MEIDDLHILLADDDDDDCLLFKEALDEIPALAKLSIVRDGIELIQFLNENKNELPDVLFLDLNMPRKNGFQCLSEIKSDKKFELLPVIIYSTSCQPDVVELLYKSGAQNYIQKPAVFSKMKATLHYALVQTIQMNKQQTVQDKFILKV